MQLGRKYLSFNHQGYVSSYLSASCSNIICNQSQASWKYNGLNMLLQNLKWRFTNVNCTSSPSFWRCWSLWEICAILSCCHSWHFALAAGKILIVKLHCCVVGTHSRQFHSFKVISGIIFLGLWKRKTFECHAFSLLATSFTFSNYIFFLSSLQFSFWTFREKKKKIFMSCFSQLAIAFYAATYTLLMGKWMRT